MKLDQATAIVLAATIPTITEAIAAVIHYLHEKRTREAAERTLEKVDEVKHVAKLTERKVEEVKSIVQNGK